MRGGARRGGEGGEGEGEGEDEAERETAEVHHVQDLRGAPEAWWVRPPRPRRHQRRPPRPCPRGRLGRRARRHHLPRRSKSKHTMLATALRRSVCTSSDIFHLLFCGFVLDYSERREFDVSTVREHQHKQVSLIRTPSLSCRCHRSGPPSMPEGGASAAKEEEELRTPWPPPRGRHPRRPPPVPCPCLHWGRTWPSAGPASRACASGRQEAWPPQRQQLTHGRRRDGRGARRHSWARRSRTYDGMWTAGDLQNATAFLDLLFCFSTLALFTLYLCVLFLF